MKVQQKFRPEDLKANRNYKNGKNDAEKRCVRQWGIRPDQRVT